MGRPINKDSTDQSTVIRIIDNTTGLPETGVEHDTAGIDLWYRREGATKTSITEAALAALDSAHSDGGIEHIADGYYRLDLPDAAWATGADGVAIGGTVTGMVVIGNYHALVDYDPYDSVRMGMTALPNAAADAAGGLPISDAGGLDLDTQIGTDIDAILSDTNELQTDWANGGRLDLIIDAILDDTDALPASVWDLASALTIDFGTLLERLYQLINNKISVVDATGATTLRNIGDTGDLATNTIEDDDTTTNRGEWSWA